MPSESAYVFAAHSAQGPPGGPKKPRRRRAQRVRVRVRRALGAGPAVWPEEAEAAETVRLHVAHSRSLRVFDALGAGRRAQCVGVRVHRTHGAGADRRPLQTQSVCASLRRGASECTAQSAHASVPSVSA